MRDHSEGDDDGSRKEFSIDS